MIEPHKLNNIRGGQKRRKLALCLGALERGIVGSNCPAPSYNQCVAPSGVGGAARERLFHGLSRTEYVKKIIDIVLSDPGLSSAAVSEIRAAREGVPFDERRACNIARNHLLALIGTFPAEWDLIIAPHSAQNGRAFIPGVMAYAEDIRSPFNLGSIFRTAESFGAEKIFLSPFCCPCEHPRAARSAMGSIDALPHERIPLEDLPLDTPVFVLETGGTPLDKFRFPRRGVLIVGSEELGASPQALRAATAGCVSIPLTGLKTSLNAGVAFGIAMNAWVNFLYGNQP
jgi:TrmH family RNA methyltransferase